MLENVRKEVIKMTDNFIATENGNIKISDEVISTIVAVATKEVSGISGLNLSLTDEITSRFVKKNSLFFILYIK